MSSEKRVISMLLTSLCLFALGSGLLMSYDALYLHYLEKSNTLIGGISAAHYLGMLCGALYGFRHIKVAGLGKAYIGFVILNAIMVFGHMLTLLVPWVWLLLRFGVGYSIASIYVIIELCLLQQGMCRIADGVCLST